MKGPRDSELANMAPAAPEEVPGGKVRLRQQLFARQRGLPLEPTEPRPRGRRGGTAPGTTPEMLAQAYIDAASQLAPPSGPPAGPPGPPPSWRFLGPVGMANGQTYGASRVTVSGRVAAIAVDPGNSNHILVGSAGGGIWESQDSGANWAPRTDFQPTLTIGAVAFDPHHPAIVYAGTGEGNFYWSLGAGLLRSTNGGTTWSMLATGPFVGNGFYDLVVDPGDSAHLVAATIRGVYVSTDGGATWTQTRSAITWAVSIAPPGGASSEVLAASRDGIYRSTDGGKTWTAVSLPSAPATWNRVGVAHAPSSPAIAYAWGSSGGSAHLYRRTTGGTWQAVAPPPGVSVGQDWYDWYVKVAPDNANQVYLGSIDLYRGDLSGSTWSWLDLSSKPVGDSIHPDQHALTFDPATANTIYAGSDGGLFRSRNRGVNWEALNSGLGITEIEYLAEDYGSSRWLLGGTQDNGSIRWNGWIWEHVADGDGGHCGVNRADPNTVFHTYYGMGLERSIQKGNFGSWQWLPPPVPANYRAEFYPPMGVNNTTVAQAGMSVFASRDSATSWHEVGLPAGVTASTISLPSQDRIVVGTEDGRVFRIDWAGSAWGAATELTRPRQAFMTDILVDTTNPNRMWATYGWLGAGRVFRSDDGGTTWHDCTSNLPNLPINTVQVDPGNTNRVWVGADVGVYQSLDAGATWAPFSNGLANALVEDLIFQPHARVLRCGTRNRGVWEIPVDGWMTQPVCGVQWTGTLAANSSQRWFTFNWPATWHVIWTVMPTTVRSGSPEATWKVEVERASAEFVTYWITVTNLTPIPVTFEGRYCILSRY